MCTFLWSTVLNHLNFGEEIIAQHLFAVSNNMKVNSVNTASL